MPVASSGVATCILFFVHSVLCLIRSLHPIYCFFVRFFFQKKLNSAEISRKFRNLSQKTPKKVAVVLDDKESKDLENLAKLLYWLAVARVGHVAVYDVEGFVKRSHRELKNLLEKNCDFEKDVIFQVKPSLLSDEPGNFLSLPEESFDLDNPLSLSKGYLKKKKKN